jgi:hypothetical protein
MWRGLWCVVCGCLRCVLANFPVTHYIMLNTVTQSDGVLRWTGQGNNNAANTTIIDVGSDGILTQGSDSYNVGQNITRFSGYYVSVGGQHFGIFNVGVFWVIPYNANQLNLGANGVPIAPEIDSGSTSLFSIALTTAANCFLTGTRIATPQGARPIESLRPGDTILSADGRTIPVVWVWHQETPNLFGLDPDRAPIRITAHALGPNCPDRDLMVTGDHALLVDGLLIHAAALINGTTIQRLPLSALPATFGYWHIETEGHSLVMAENCPAESFAPYTARSSFDSHPAYLARYGGDRVFAEMRLPRIGAARLVPPCIRAKLGITIGAAAGPLRGPLVGHAA